MGGASHLHGRCGLPGIRGGGSSSFWLAKFGAKSPRLGHAHVGREWPDAKQVWRRSDDESAGLPDQLGVSAIAFGCSACARSVPDPFGCRSGVARAHSPHGRRALLCAACECARRAGAQATERLVFEVRAAPQPDAPGARAWGGRQAILRYRQGRARSDEDMRTAASNELRSGWR